MYEKENIAIMYENGLTGILYRGKGCNIVSVTAVYVNTNIGIKSIVPLNVNL